MRNGNVICKRKAISIILGAILITSAASAFFSVPTIAQVLQINKPDNFETMCSKKTNLSKSMQYTIAILLKKSGSEDCKIAAKTLSTLNNLAIHDQELSNLEPISLLKNLKNLSLWNNNINDLRPLMSLENLESLNLGENQVTDITPLANLVRLKKLWLDSNRITSIAAIGLNHRLELLSIKSNLLTSISPSENLWRLKHLDTRLNPYLHPNNQTKISAIANRAPPPVN